MRKHNRTRRITGILLVFLLCIPAFSAFAKVLVTEPVKIPLSRLRTTEAFASGPYYEALLNAMRTSAGLSAAERFVRIAESQVGYTGGKKSTQLKGNGAGGKYCEYNNHTSAAGYDWCAAFVSWCAEAAGLSTEVMERSNYANGKLSETRRAWVNPERAKTAGTFYRNWSDTFRDYLAPEPRPGDLCIFQEQNDWQGGSHVEIVKEAVQGEDGVWIITTVGRGPGNQVRVSAPFRADISDPLNRSVRRVKGFFRPDWDAASVWSKTDVAEIDRVILSGDANLDGSVDGRDAVRLMRLLAGETEEETGLPPSVDERSADLNDDDRVNELDLLRLMQLLAQ